MIMKNDHEMLKEIIDKIWFNISIINYWIKFDKLYWFHLNWWEKYWKTYNVREIIFTQEFMGKLETKLMGIFRPNTSNVKVMLNWILYHLDNPVEYLYNLIN